MILASIWTLAFLVASPTYVDYSVMPVTTTSQDGDNATVATTALSCMPTSRQFDQGNAIFIIFVSYLIPQVLIISRYYRLVSFIVRQGRQTSGALTSSFVLNNRKRIVKMLIIIAALFSVAWLPYFVLLVMVVSGYSSFLYRFGSRLNSLYHDLIISSIFSYASNPEFRKLDCKSMCITLSLSWLIILSHFVLLDGSRKDSLVNDCLAFSSTHTLYHAWIESYPTRMYAFLQKMSGQSNSLYAASGAVLVQQSLALFSTSYNIVVYLICNAEFRRSFISMFCRNRTSAVHPAGSSEPASKRGSGKVAVINPASHGQQ